MRTLSLTSLLLLVVVSAAASITGTVIDETGKPIAGATVRAWVVEPSVVYRQRLISAYDHTATEPEWALGYRWDIVLTGAEATPFEETHPAPLGAAR